uniref:Secreted protein n=1 Tax=Glossina pallidipes TaxID=7398 RepID=A0A1A9ZMP8_GLOPL
MFHSFHVVIVVVPHLHFIVSSPFQAASAFTVAAGADAAAAAAAAAIAVALDVIEDDISSCPFLLYFWD